MKSGTEIIRELGENTLLKAMEIAHLGCWEWNIEDSSARWSDEQFRILGYEPGEITPTYDHFIKAVHSEDLSKVLAAVKNALDNISPYNIEFRIIHPDSSERTVLAQGEVVRDNENNPVRMVGTVLDITEHKQVEKELQRISKAVESASDAIGMSDPRGNHFYHNSAFTELFGYTAKELDAAGGPTVVYADKSVARELFYNIMSGRSWSGDIEMVSKSGRKFPASVRADAIKDEAQNIIGLIGIVTDITERKEKDSIIQEGSDRYDAFVKNSTEAIYSIDLEKPMDISISEEDQIDHIYKYGYVGEANEAWARIGNFRDAKELIGIRIEEFMPRSIPENMDFLKEFIRAKYCMNDFETVEEYKAGAKINAMNSVTGIIGNGHLMKIWGTGRDITKMKQTENTLRDNQKDLQKLAGRLITKQENELQHLARELHDDLTQQLAVLAIEIGSIEQKDDLPASVIEKMSYIKEQLIKTSKSVHNLSRNLHPSIIKDLGLERAVRSECSNLSSRTGIAVVFTPKNIPSSITSDVSLSIYRIIQEGLSNIVKHANTKNAYVFLESNDSSILLTVRDTGTGFDPTEVRHKAALGLGSMRERVRLVNGELAITSKPGKGTSIEVEIPLTKNDE